MDLTELAFLKKFLCLSAFVAKLLNSAYHQFLIVSQPHLQNKKGRPHNTGQPFSLLQ